MLFNVVNIEILHSVRSEASSLATVGSPLIHVQDDERREACRQCSHGFVVVHYYIRGQRQQQIRHPYVVDSGALGRYFDDAIIHALKHRLRDYEHLITPHTILTAGGAMLDGTAEGVLQGLVTDDNGNQILVRADIVMAPGIKHNLFSVMSAAKRAL